MFKNVYVGDIAKDQPVKILILGESHYEERNAIDGTHSVVDYLAVNGNDDKTQFYKNIMKTFGYKISPDQRKQFWSKVFCGNYVSELCWKGKGNNAPSKIKCNRTLYNNQLFEFVNDHKIDVVFCFSRLVYNNLPCATNDEKECILIQHPTNSLRSFEYQAFSKHENCDVTLEKPLTVYGLRHSSSGFSPSVYCEYFDTKQYIL